MLYTEKEIEEINMKNFALFENIKKDDIKIEELKNILSSFIEIVDEEKPRIQEGKLKYSDIRRMLFMMIDKERINSNFDKYKTYNEKLCGENLSSTSYSE